MDKERTTQEGQVTYPVFTGRPGYLPALAHLEGCTLRFYLCHLLIYMKHSMCDIFQSNNHFITLLYLIGSAKSIINTSGPYSLDSVDVELGDTESGCAS